MNLRERLSTRLNKEDICELCIYTRGKENNKRKQKLYQLVRDSDDRVAYNALWVFNNFSLCDNDWLYSKHDELIDMVMKEQHTGKKRLFLSLLLRQSFEEDNLRTDFLDFCLSKIPSCIESYATRALCIKLSYEQCKFYSELLQELRVSLEMISSEPLSPGLKSAVKNVLKKI
nr:hypothetical protein [Prevotella sp.]